MFQQVLQVCNKLGMQNLGDFLYFSKNRVRLLKTLTVSQKRFLGIINLSLNIMRNKKALPPSFLNMASYTSEYMCYKLTPEDLIILENLLIETGKFLEIKRTQINDPLLRTISSFGSGQMNQILRL